MREQGLGIANNDLDTIAVNKKYYITDEIKQKITDFIDTLIPAGTEFSLKKVSFENGMYKATVDLNGDEIDSYVNEDLTKFFPSAMDMNAVPEKEAVSNTKSTSGTSATKTDKPKVELFVMSHCPYGTQMEKGLLPVLDILGDTIDFELKFNDYAMHSKKELDEQMSQYCIQENNPEKLVEYLYCFLDDETQAEVCLDNIGIDKNQHSACVISTDEEYKITEMYNDRDTWRSGRFPAFPIFEDDNKTYGITGSPGLVINRSKVQTGRSSADLLETICTAFNEQPEDCLAELSDVTPSPGFGFDGSGSSASASCGS